ncbi:glycoside hydrolase family 57 protein [soil metagenome]
MKKSIVLYMHVHQPFRIRHYTIFDAGNDHRYFDSHYDDRTNNERIIHKVAEKSYIPTNRMLLSLLQRHPEFKISLSITGTLLEQLAAWSPATLRSFQELTATGRVEIVGETYYHSLAFFYSQTEFEAQVNAHRELVQKIFNQTPTAFRNTELAYNNNLAYWADNAGYKAILAEGWDPVLGWRSPNYVYQPTHTTNIKLLMKNYKLSDDIAFRFSDQNWVEWPLTADKFTHWLNESSDATNFNLFMDYETFGEHQWGETGIFSFLEHLPNEWLKGDNHTFMTVSEAADAHEARDRVDTPYTTTWADTERDLSAWLGNPMQHQAITALYELRSSVMKSNDENLIHDWRKLQTSDHLYYMCTKWFNDGDIHAYFSPYETPYEAFMNFINSYHDMKFRLTEKGFTI